MRKKLFCRLTGLVLMLCLLCGMLSRLSSLTNLKSVPNRYDDFLGSKRQYDVFLLGNSHLWDGVYPLEMWNRCGISSYDLSFAGAHTGSLYYIFLTALEYAEPKVVVLNCSFLTEEAGGKTSYFRNALAAFPFSFNKVRAAYDLCPPGQFSAEDRLSLIWGFSLFHDRWSALFPGDFTWEEPKLRGAYPIINILEVEPPFETGAKYPLDVSTPNVPYIYRIAEECRKRDIRLVLTTLPFSASEEDVMVANALEDIAAQLNVPYLNLLGLDLVDYRSDFGDGLSHLNLSGACKVSAFLADFLAESCALPDHRGDPAYAEWDADYASWLETLDSYLQQGLLLRHILMMLSHPHYASVIRIAPGSGLFNDERIPSMLRSLCGGAELPGFAEAAAAGKSYVLYYDRAAGKAYEAVGTDRIAGAPCGEILVRSENCLVQIGGTEFPLAVVCGAAADAEAQCFVFTAEMTPLTSCSHSFSPGEGGEYYRNDYPD